MLSMHTSPLAQPGAADAGGMNVYVRELATSLAQAGVAVRVYTRATREMPPAPREVEPNLVVVPVDEPDDRRHWHRSCWSRRTHRRPR